MIALLKVFLTPIASAGWNLVVWSFAWSVALWLGIDAYPGLCIALAMLMMLSMNFVLWRFLRDLPNSLVEAFEISPADHSKGESL